MGRGWPLKICIFLPNFVHRQMLLLLLLLLKLLFFKKKPLFSLSKISFGPLAFIYSFLEARISLLELSIK